MNDLEFSQAIRKEIKNGNVDRVSSLLDSKRECLNLITPFGTWLHVAATVGSLEVFKRLVELGADINLRGGTFEAGPLKTAASYGRIDIVKFILSIGVEIEIDEPFRNPLYGAIYGGYLDIVKLLVEYGIDPKYKYTGVSRKDFDAISYARDQGRIEIFEYLNSISSH